VGLNKKIRVLEQILSGQVDANIPFNGLCHLLIDLGFHERVKGSHHIFARDGVDEIINLQPLGSKVKSYQVKQVRNLVLKYRLGDAHHD
jgi:predicted RNA binding protein YcfA (HicA-like mRNA interferase family)